MKHYILNIFDSKNTAIKKEYITYNHRLARDKAMRLSTAYPKIILEYKNEWDEYQEGKLTAWSYPLGIKGSF